MKSTSSGFMRERWSVRMSLPSMVCLSKLREYEAHGCLANYLANSAECCHYTPDNQCDYSQSYL